MGDRTFGQRRPPAGEEQPLRDLLPDLGDTLAPVPTAKARVAQVPQIPRLEHVQALPKRILASPVLVIPLEVIDEIERDREDPLRRQLRPGQESLDLPSAPPPLEERRRQHREEHHGGVELLRDHRPPLVPAPNVRLVLEDMEPRHAVVAHLCLQDVPKLRKPSVRVRVVHVRVAQETQDFSVLLHRFGAYPATLPASPAR